MTMPLEQKPVKPPTQSVVEVHQLQLAPPDPDEEVTNTQCISGAAETVQVKLNEAVSQV